LRRTATQQNTTSAGTIGEALVRAMAARYSLPAPAAADLPGLAASYAREMGTAAAEFPNDATVR